MPLIDGADSRVDPARRLVHPVEPAIDPDPRVSSAARSQSPSSSASARLEQRLLGPRPACRSRRCRRRPRRRRRIGPAPRSRRRGEGGAHRVAGDRGPPDPEVVEHGEDVRVGPVLDLLGRRLAEAAHVVADHAVAGVDERRTTGSQERRLTTAEWTRTTGGPSPSSSAGEPATGNVDPDRLGGESARA